MSLNRVMGNPAFWNFVRDIRNKDANAPAAAPARVDASEKAPLPEMQEVAPMPMNSGNERSLPQANAKAGLKKQGGAGPAKIDFPKLRARLQNKGLNDQQIEARIAKRRGNRAQNALNAANQAGPDAFPKLQERLRKKGVSQTDINARVEKRRAFLAGRVARINGQDAKKDKKDAAPKANKGPFAARRHMNTGVGNVQGDNENLRAGPAMPMNAESAAVPAMPAGTTETGPRGRAFRGFGRGGRGAMRGQNQFTHIDQIAKGGPKKFMNPDGTSKVIPDNAAPRGLGGRRGRHGHGVGVTPHMETLVLHDAENPDGAAAPHGRRGRGLKAHNKPAHAKPHAHAVEDDAKGDGNMAPHPHNPALYKPRIDVFETAGSYIAHVPVPGALQQEVAVTWVPERESIHVAGVVRRPQELPADATLLAGARLVGPFERRIALAKLVNRGRAPGAPRRAVRVYEHGISATLDGGVLTVEVPKYDGPDAEAGVPAEYTPPASDDEDGDAAGFVRIDEKTPFIAPYGRPPAY